MKPLFEVCDEFELFALWRLVAEAKFHSDPEDSDLWGSPFVNALSRKIPEAMLLSYLDAGQTEKAKRHREWLQSLPNNVVLPSVKAKLKRDALRPDWPKSYEAKAKYVKECISPFLVNDDFIRELIEHAES